MNRYSNIMTELAPMIHSFSHQDVNENYEVFYFIYFFEKVKVDLDSQSVFIVYILFNEWLWGRWHAKSN